MTYLDLFENALRRYPGPIRDGRLGDSNAARKFGNAADGANSLLEFPNSHGLPWLFMIPRTAPSRCEQEF